MPSNRLNQPPPPETLQRQHEWEDPSARAIFLAAGSVVLLLAACLAVTVWMMDLKARKQPLDPLIALRGIVTAPSLALLERFPPPTLQLDPHDDLVALRAREDAELATYGWVDRSNSIVRIPIERAMALLVQRGLPTRSSNAPPRTGASSLELIRERTR